MSHELKEDSTRTVFKSTNGVASCHQISLLMNSSNLNERDPSHWSSTRTVFHADGPAARRGDQYERQRQQQGLLGYENNGSENGRAWTAQPSQWSENKSLSDRQLTFTTFSNAGC